jgi:hypothetical protein
MTVVIRQADGLVSASPGEFDSEAELERVLADQVQLLQSTTDHRLAFVGRQIDLPDAGILDVLCVDENGLPVEVKLARNGEARRQVVAQIVDYLSALTSLTVDELDARTEGALNDALRSFDPPAGDPGSFERRWQACGANLRAGLARIIVPLDSAPTDLERIVQFLSERSNLDIWLVTISKFVEPRVGTLYVPTVLVSNEGEPAPRPSARPSARAGGRAPSPGCSATRPTPARCTSTGTNPSTATRRRPGAGGARRAGRAAAHRANGCRSACRPSSAQTCSSVRRRSLPTTAASVRAI